jgi:hypothetical protein
MNDIVKCPACDAEQPMDVRIDSFIFGGFSARCECSKCGYKGMWSGAKLYREEAKKAAIERADKGVKRK